MKSRTPPKRRNAIQTKAKILAAAQQTFSETGYSQSGIRDSAAIADVSSTLLLRYYGSKTALFEAALFEAMPIGDLHATTVRSQFGEGLARAILDTRLDIKPPSIIALATGDADARDVATRVIDARILAPMAKWRGPPDASARALEILILAMGFVLFTRQFPLLPARRGADQIGRAHVSTPVTNA